MSLRLIYSKVSKKELSIILKDLSAIHNWTAQLYAIPYMTAKETLTGRSSGTIVCVAGQYLIISGYLCRRNVIRAFPWGAWRPLNAHVETVEKVFF